MPTPPLPDYAHWRSPQQQQTPLHDSTALPDLLSPRVTDSPALRPGKKDLMHPAFLPPCEHGGDGDMHAHAFDLLSLSGGPPSQPRRAHPQTTASTPQAIPSSVPSRPSYLSATKPQAPIPDKAGKENAPRQRRMSSSTTGVLGRGKLGLTGAGPTEGLGLNGVGKDSRAPTVTAPAGAGRRSTLGSSPAPQLFDFARTDRRPSMSKPAPSAPLPGRSQSLATSVPTRASLRRPSQPAPVPLQDDIELDMEFDGDDDEDDGEIRSGRSGSADIDMEDDDDGALKPEYEKLALGTGSGGVKGRRKGMVFKCETCNKEYKHPSCLVKHRWEHSPHWKEPTALSMSKHQQVQMLEAAAILAHLGPAKDTGRSLPSDKSLWPSILSPAAANEALPRRGSRTARDISLGRSPSISSAAPLTPSSLRDSTTLDTLVEGKDRDDREGSDSTTSSMGASEPYIPRRGSISASHLSPRAVPNGLGIRSPPTSSPYARPRPMGLSSESRAPSSLSSSIPGPATPHSIGSLPDMNGLKFASSLSSSLTVPGSGMSPIPGRNAMPVYMKTGMVGGGMFGVRTQVPSSSVRSGAGVEEEDEEDSSEDKAREDEAENWGVKENKEREGEDWGMALEMEL
ncbi:hypothetical protein L198_06014 [Cryptococcus wingfieldii CBS 7118]|uniref:C2H2-type domain-containing protein n=1 Tax=Cryptococcus wingfieldii CBS 7118 TaxID=1295528 RepID=A0A1E3IQ81_9TREE|nr:hypothetical protein L198_06014 [Cryptococcus wingfieldii CBS 7118]ODN90698.1 hypothetical protein L198_06014 [Cryptococcus wingfieldii CBS 7118]